jgi:hypothetical protein
MTRNSVKWLEALGITFGKSHMHPFFSFSFSVAFISRGGDQQYWDFTRQGVVLGRLDNM